MLLSGGCYYGHVRYETDGMPYHEMVCHCSICRRSSGAPTVAWFSVPRSRFRLLRGTPAQFCSPKGIRSFCRQCGTQLTFAPDDSGLMEREMKRVKNGKLYLIPPSEETRGHATTAFAKFYAKQLQEFLLSVKSRGP
jgi:hypothetical protein